MLIRPCKPLNAAMKNKAVETAIAQFMKSIDHTARREIEKTIRKAFADGTLQPGESFTSGLAVSCAALDLDITVFGKIDV